MGGENQNFGDDKLSWGLNQNYGFNGLTQIVNNNASAVKGLLEYQEILNHCDVKTRVYLLRHYPYKECIQLDKYNKLLEDKIAGRLNDSQKKYMSDLGDRLEIYDDISELSNEQSYIYHNIFKGDGTYIFYDKSDKENRVYKTAIDLEKRFKPKTTSESDSKLLPSNKKLSTGESFGRLNTDFNALYHGECMKLIKREDVRNIVIVSNRSYSQPFETIGGGNLDKSTRESIDQMEKDGYLYLDYDNNGKLIPNNNYTLKIKPDSYILIKFELYKYGFRLKHNSIVDFQNGINKYFNSNPNLFKTILLSSRQDLRIFSIANLTKNGEYDLIKENFDKLLEYEDNNSLLYFSETVLKIFTDVEQREDFLRSLIRNGKVHHDLKGECKYFIDYEREVVPKKNKIKDVSYDERIKQGDLELIIEHDKGNVIYANSLARNSNVNEFLRSTDRNKNILVLESEPGGGKSLEHLDIMEACKPVCNDKGEYNNMGNYLTPSLKRIGY